MTSALVRDPLIRDPLTLRSLPSLFLLAHEAVVVGPALDRSGGRRLARSARCFVHVLRIDAEPLAQLEAGFGVTSLAARRSPATARSGLMWSFVTGEMPPQSLMPASRYMPYASGVRFGGAWMFISAPRISRAVAIVRSISKTLGSSRWRIAMSSFTRKFWTITSWMWPYSSCSSRIANSESTRSSRVSPMPMRMPVVHAMLQLAGVRASCGGAPRAPCRGSSSAPCPSRAGASTRVSSIMPIEALHVAQRRRSPRASMMPGLACGSRPVSRSTSSHISRRYDDVVVVAEAREVVADEVVDLLRPLAEREQRLLAALPLARRARPPAPRPATSCARSGRAGRARTCSSRTSAGRGSSAG